MFSLRNCVHIFWGASKTASVSVHCVFSFWGGGAARRGRLPRARFPCGCRRGSCSLRQDASPGALPPPPARAPSSVAGRGDGHTCPGSPAGDGGGGGGHTCPGSPAGDGGEREAEGFTLFSAVTGLSKDV